MPLVTHRAVRLACDLGNINAALDARTNLPPSALRGATLLVQLAAFLDGAIYPPENFSSVTIVCRAITDAGEVGTQQFTESTGTVIACTREDWLSGAAQQAEIALSAAQLNLTAGRYVILVYGLTDAAEKVPWAHTSLTVVDAGLTDIDPPAEADDSYSDAQMNARFLAAAPDGHNAKHGAPAIPAAAQSLAVVFTTPFSGVPRNLSASLRLPSADGYIIPVVIDSSTISATGFTARWAAPTPDALHLLDWWALL